MCELLGMSFNLPVQPKFSFKEFRKRGYRNPHGWGLGFYPDNTAIVIKEPRDAIKSKLSNFVNNYPYIRSEIIISHVRYATHGKSEYRNTHPFQRIIYGKDFVFAHNGSLRANYLELGYLEPLGETDSERLFCYILENFRYDYTYLQELLNEINDFGTMNLIFSDGEYLFAYHDKHGYKNLYAVRRGSPSPGLSFEDDVMSLILDEEKDPDQHGYVISTDKLTNERWRKIKKGKLVVFKDGKVINPSGLKAGVGTPPQQ